MFANENTSRASREIVYRALGCDEDIWMLLWSRLSWSWLFTQGDRDDDDNNDYYDDRNICDDRNIKLMLIILRWC